MVHVMLTKEERLYYNSLLDYCRDSVAKEVSKILAKNDKIDILYHDGVLLRIAANDGGAEILNMLIDYYIAHISGEPKSDEYLSAMYKLVEALNVTRQLSEKFSPEVTEIFNKYIPADYEKESWDGSNFAENEATITEEGSLPKEIAESYSSDEFHKRVSASSDSISFVDIPDLTVSTIGDTQAPPE